MKKIEVENGSTFKMDGKWYLVVESDADYSDCEGCAFDRTPECRQVPCFCLNSERQDGKDVIFVEVESEND